ncbi:hypothetical protein G6F37_007552 [Rhizopus arrhizus]|nr:hypothetical protein G6F38_007875 [Rhizopus arrhizus]KAG1156498.1 hypothetical protein G6F37_007552 [Rhizopus arrhizus]
MTFLKKTTLKSATEITTEKKKAVAEANNDEAALKNDASVIDVKSTPKGTAPAHFIKFINELLDIMDEDGNLKGSYLRMDNASIHKSKSMIRKIEVRCYRGNAIIKANWDKKLTLRQNYAKLGLLTSLNGQTGGSEKKMPEESVAEQEPIDLKELTEEEIEKLKKTLGPGEGIIQRDDEGNVVRVIVGEAKSHDEILDAEVEPVEAKTDVVRQLEEQAANAFHREKYQSGFETHWIQKLIDKHGDDYKAMFWDKELNVNQHTAAQLKKKCEKYLEKHQ